MKTYRVTIFFEGMKIRIIEAENMEDAWNRAGAVWGDSIISIEEVV